MKTATRTDVATRAPEPIVIEQDRSGSRWPFVAAALVVVALAIAAFAVVNQAGVPPRTAPAVYLDAQTGLREGGAYAEPIAPTSEGAPNAMTGVREGGAYGGEDVALDPMTGVREGGAYRPA